MANRLQWEKSPYLLQHRDQPVDWYPWGAEAFEKARMEDKPVFLSIGYSTCHWCHVMAHESFEDGTVAAVLNREYVCVKVDREERPEIDAVYMAACQAMTGSGGWPLTVFLTPDQRPFFAGTYFSKEGRYGQTGLLELLGQVSRLWRQERRRLLEAGARITQVLQESAAVAGKPERLLLHRAYKLLQQSFDGRWGGFGAAPKFPTPHDLLFLLYYAEQTGEQQAGRMAETTLRAMARGGIQDQIGGGFSRYATDKAWRIPHFEKMLYDNALLILAYLRAYQDTGEAFYAGVARRTAEYLCRELMREGGGFFCGQDADSDGVEGKYYVFTPAEAAQVLGEADGAEFCRRYGISAVPNFEGGSIPNRIDATGEAWPAEDPRLRKLYDYRKARTRLHTDDKLLFSWNAWAVTALSQAGMILNEPRFLNAALQTYHFLEENMTGPEGRLFHRFRDGEAAYDGQLEDYACSALSLLALYRATFQPALLQAAKRRAAQFMERFGDPAQGGYYMYASDAEQLIARPRETYDGALPSGNSVAAVVLEALASLTGEERWREAADRQHRFMAGRMESYPAGSSFALLALGMRLYPHRELLCAGANVPPELTAYLRRNAAAGLSVLWKSPENAAVLAECAPFTAAYPVPEHETVWYLCEGGACRTPETAFDRLGL